MNSRLVRVSPLNQPPIDRVWQDALMTLGLRLQRTDAAYASSDGAGTLSIGSVETLDADDSLAQLVLHELCHALVQGEDNWARADWGLDNTSDRDCAREQACLRLQAHLADSVGLRAQMVPTTEWREYYERLPEQPLHEAAADDAPDACALAQAGAARALLPTMAPVLTRALTITAALVQPAATEVPERHPLGFRLGAQGQRCGTCAWAYQGGRGTAVHRCRQASEKDNVAADRRIDPAYPACERWEAPVACDTCGACCREAYHVVSVAMRDPVVWKQPALIVRQGHRFSVLRDGGRCAALTGNTGESPQPFACRIYDDRPQTCRDFALGGANCLVARRRVGLSR